jgi:hypothetical protein
MKASHTLPQIKEVLDLIQHVDGKSDPELYETRISTMYRTVDGRTVVVFDGMLVDRETFFPHGPDEDDIGEIHYFNRCTDAETFWILHLDRIVGRESKQEAA